MIYSVKDARFVRDAGFAIKIQQGNSSFGFMQTIHVYDGAVKIHFPDGNFAQIPSYYLQKIITEWCDEQKKDNDYVVSVEGDATELTISGK